MIRITIGTKCPITIEIDDDGGVEPHEIPLPVRGSIPTALLDEMATLEWEEPSDDALEEDWNDGEPLSNGVDVESAVEAAILQEELMQVGKGSLQTLVEAWADGFGAPLDEKGHSTVEQPDRAKLLQAVMAKSGRSVMAYIEHCGAGNAEQRGLRTAIRSVFPSESAVLPEGIDYDAFIDEIAGNIVQLASIYVPPLADTIEYTHADSRG